MLRLYQIFSHHDYPEIICTRWNYKAVVRLLIEHLAMYLQLRGACNFFHAFFHSWYLVLNKGATNNWAVYPEPEWDAHHGLTLLHMGQPPDTIPTSLPLQDALSILFNLGIPGGAGHGQPSKPLTIFAILCCPISASPITGIPGGVWYTCFVIQPLAPFRYPIRLPITWCH